MTRSIWLRISWFVPLGRSGVAGFLTCIARWLKSYALAGLRVTGYIGACLMIVVLAGCADGPSATVDSGGPSAAQTIPYRIGPGDTLSVFVYGAPELGVKNEPVRPDGRFSMPLVPNIDAAGKTTTELDQELAQRLSKYMKSPNVTVMVDSFHGALGTGIRVLAAGDRPKSVPYIDHMTLLDVMTDVGGPPKFGALNDAYIVRRSGGQEHKIPVQLGALLNRGDMSQNVVMRPGDIVVIPQTIF